MTQVPAKEGKELVLEAGSTFREELPDNIEESSGFEGFRNGPVRTEDPRGLERVVGAETGGAGDRDDLDVGVSPFQFTDGLESVPLRHKNIHDDEIEGSTLKKPPPCAPQ